MQDNRGEDPAFLRDRWARFEAMVANKDVAGERDKRAFLMTPREEFVLNANRERAYDHAFLDIGFGVTISGPHLVGRMTSALDVARGDKVL
ncbi:MAG: protein-L-isoaspartate O-methyltransferase, partial [Alphaproteobacteria bacterium]|nr:protein-L-isoaspartate O-methyltransferase [Alphaproteobacteria bacterium]